jgi:serine/threonine-protein kinase RsbW
VPEPDLSCDLEDRQIGGLGVYLMRQLMDEVKYEQHPGAGNVLVMVKRRRREK